MNEEGNQAAIAERQKRGQLPQKETEPGKAT